jgi:hypothetical protein
MYRVLYCLYRAVVLFRLSIFILVLSLLMEGLLPSSDNNAVINIFPFHLYSIAMYRMRQFLAVLRSFFNSSLLYTLSCRFSPPTILPSFFTSSCHIFLGLPLGLVVSKFVDNILLAILFPSILCTCPNQRNLRNLTVSVMVCFF